MKVFLGAKIYSLAGPVMDQGMFKVDPSGKIVDIGEDIKIDSQDQRIDLSGKVVIPGLIDGHSHVGMWGDGEGFSSMDGNEMVRPISGDVRALDSVNPRQASFQAAREGGITTVQILPGSSNPIGGLGFACKTFGGPIDAMVVKSPTALKGATGENPKRRHGGEGRSPFSRMGISAIIRDYFDRAQAYGEEKAQAEQKGQAFSRDLNLESGLMALKKEVPFRIHAHRHDDIVSAIRICEDYDLDFTIEHCTEGHLIADYLGKKKITAMVGAGLSSSGKVELAQVSDKNPAILAANGVRVCLMTDHPFLNCRYFLHYGAVTYKYGLPFEETLKAMTLYPAQVLGIEDRVGSLAKGKDADFVVLNGEPFTLQGSVEQTYGEGQLIWQRPSY